jgi:hypothetical protein
MSIQKYDYSGVLNAIDIEEWVSYNDHIAEVKRVRSEIISENEDWILMPTLALDQIKQYTAEAMRAACIAAVEALPPFHNAALLHKVEDVLAVLREVQP